MTEADEEGKERGVSMESTAGTKERSPDGLSLPIQNAILINKVVIFYKIWKSTMKFN